MTRGTLQLLLMLQVSAAFTGTSYDDNKVCKQKFGAAGPGITVVDLDAPNGVFSPPNKIFVHYVGGTRCYPPTPPRGIHRYVTVKYSDPSCLHLGDEAVGTLSANSFTAKGVYGGCQAAVESLSTTCYTGGSDAVQVQCPESA
eukprot:CAMPEP_0197878104 /NCGR_PEP_ID=MMETSP1439-20131203/6581_1 /TAXON_ID=66791 /ORGANISM="Gonyaulax spinifera, Strain CCMP409" /LENGTH=142 /DNA_ID=CAMNT_0043497487 /DNA_START=78 /DNA_END=506 /DNA_ORIENTATION=+